jgi:hypothetical protein
LEHFEVSERVSVMVGSNRGLIILLRPKILFNLTSFSMVKEIGLKVAHNRQPLVEISNYSNRIARNVTFLFLIRLQEEATHPGELYF